MPFNLRYFFEIILHIVFARVRDDFADDTSPMAPLLRSVDLIDSLSFRVTENGIAGGVVREMELYNGGHLIQVRHNEATVQ